MKRADKSFHREASRRQKRANVEQANALNSREKKQTQGRKRARTRRRRRRIGKRALARIHSHSKQHNTHEPTDRRSGCAGCRQLEGAVADVAVDAARRTATRVGARPLPHARHTTYARVSAHSFALAYRRACASRVRSGGQWRVVRLEATTSRSDSFAHSLVLSFCDKFGVRARAQARCVALYQK